MSSDFSIVKARKLSRGEVGFRAPPSVTVGRSYCMNSDLDGSVHYVPKDNMLRKRNTNFEARL